MTTVDAPAAPALLRSVHVRTPVRLARVIAVDHARRGAVATTDGGWFRRCEPGPAGPLVLAATSDAGGTTVEVLGPAATTAEARDTAVEAALAWAGLRDDPSGAQGLTATADMRRLIDLVGEVRLGALPRVGEALGRSVIEQLVQGKEARRSIAQLVVATGGDHWPQARVLGATPVWTLRRCGISGRMVRALHAGAVEDRRLEAARSDLAALDRRLLALPGVGAWTSAETRLRLGDPDAVSVGDYHLPTVVGYALSGPDGDGPDGAWTDAGMLELLAPFAGQRGRAIRLIETAAALGLVSRRGRRGPRAALSAHRYW